MTNLSTIAPSSPKVMPAIPNPSASGNSGRADGTDDTAPDRASTDTSAERQINSNSVCAEAHRLASSGLRVFPLAPRSKAPLRGFDGWQERATTDGEQIDEWFRANA